MCDMHGLKEGGEKDRLNSHEELLGDTCLSFPFIRVLMCHDLVGFSSLFTVFHSILTDFEV